jgi:hypothetical protein
MDTNNSTTLPALIESLGECKTLAAVSDDAMLEFDIQGWADGGIASVGPQSQANIHYSQPNRKGESGDEGNITN